MGNTFTNMWEKWSESDDASPPPRRCSSTAGRAPSRSSWTRPVSPSRRSSCCCVRRRPGRPPPASGSPPHRCWSTAGHRVQSEEVSREEQVGGQVEVTSWVRTSKTNVLECKICSKFHKDKESSSTFLESAAKKSLMLS